MYKRKGGLLSLLSRLCSQKKFYDRRSLQTLNHFTKFGNKKKGARYIILNDKIMLRLFNNFAHSKDVVVASKLQNKENKSIDKSEVENVHYSDRYEFVSLNHSKEVAKQRRALNLRVQNLASKFKFGKFSNIACPSFLTMFYAEKNKATLKKAKLHEETKF